MFSPTSIVDFLACQHLTALNRAEAAGQIQRPFFADPGLDLLTRLGVAHEQAYLQHLTQEQHLQVVAIPDEIPRTEAVERTVQAIRQGAEVIYQARFLEGEWYGRSDFLSRVDKPSQLGAFSYEVIETKLARSTKARAIIQLCFYSDLLSRIQGVEPDYMHVVLGGGSQPEKFLVHRYLAYFRKVRRELERAHGENTDPYPEPVEHCGICSWATVCDRRWREDDHLSLVAGISGSQRKGLVECGVNTVRSLASPNLPPIEGIGRQALLNIRQQARLQVKGRDEGRCCYELLEASPEKGLCSLPPPSRGDMFLDFEGDPFAFDQGLEYLFGVLTLPQDSESEPLYVPVWALDRGEERSAFERFMTSVIERRRQHPDMHIYHYGAYEETAIKRMAGRHSIFGDEVDELLRAEVLVDLYRVVRQGLRASVESYSIKKLEPLYEFNRAVQLVDANLALNTFQAVLAFGPGEEDIAEIRHAIEGYNRDDCISTLRLRDWLEERRRELEERTGTPLARPAPKAGKPTEDLSAYLERVRAVESRLIADLPTDESARTEEQEKRSLLAHLLEWHRREDKSAWWEYFRLCELTDQELQEDKVALGGLVYEGVIEQVKKSLIHRYRFPFQDHAIDRAPTVHDPRTQNGVGEIVAIDNRALTIDIKRGATSTIPHPTALIPYEIVPAKHLRESLLGIGSWVADNGIGGNGPHQAARELLLRRAPRLLGSALTDLTASNQPPIEVAKQVALALDYTVLPIQGPPGSGKTYTGARMIVELVRRGRRVGITAVSHKVIGNLLKESCNAAREARVDLQAVQKADLGDCCDDEMVTRAKDNECVAEALADGKAMVAAGTVWLWSRPEMADAVDVLFVDEAGQMSLANVLAASPAARSIVLLGDPQQLDQPQRGVHPPGAEASALSHLLNGRATIGDDQGLFLAESWRLHPDVCAFTSEVFYDSRLVSRPENARQRLNAAGPFDGTGLRFVPVNHSGNDSESTEEAERVASIVERLLGDGATWTDKEGQTGLLTLDDILIVAPYNAQVSTLAQGLPPGARVGTVDKFQGQEAPVVFYSMATSTPDDAPRGMEFLYSSNRLNVATSRAQCLTVLVASPALFDVQCKTPRQIELANAFCRYLEIAQFV
ncbi:MAG: TM0106 family RecB-like putative nuclease [Pyrinomonadaceae bacterium]|nr:TM0106 family RecB-like putative nuclease [Pyrinomonadaceae bacterium]